MKLSFKKRIAVFNTLVVAITTAIVFIVIYGVVYYSSYRHLNKDILLEKKEVLNALDWKEDSIIINKMPEWEEAEHKKVEVNPTFIQIVDNKGRMVFKSANLQTNHFLFNSSNEKEIFYNTKIDKQRFRLGQFPVRNNNGKIIGQLTIGVSQQESYTVLNNLLFTLCVAFPLMLVVLYVVILFAASKAIAPVHTLINTASVINDTNISTRLPLPKNEDEIFHLATTINELLNRIERSIQQQKQFTADASHEMRTPLAAIRGTLEVLLRKQREPEQYETKIKEVIYQVDRLSLLFDQLLQLARLESGLSMGKKEPVGLNRIIKAIAEKWQKELTEKRIKMHLVIPENTTVMSDLFFLERILDNLFGNAIKYSHEQGNIYCEWDETKKSISIKDDGSGIAQEQLPYLFNRFYRADNSRSSRIQGNGLGLAIVKKLADLQQIDISVSSTVGKGTVFTLQFIS